jgi:hypothetical protein
MSDLDQAVLFEQFVAAREDAIPLTDRFDTTAIDDPSRGELWKHIMRQTDTARRVLEHWLRSGQLTDQTPPGPVRFAFPSLLNLGAGGGAAHRLRAGVVDVG